MSGTKHKRAKYVRRMIRTRRRLAKTETREALRSEMKQQYEAGASIRELAETHKLAFGTVRTLLIEAGVSLRSRGGRNHVRRDAEPEPDQR